MDGFVNQSNRPHEVPKSLLSADIHRATCGGELTVKRHRRTRARSHQTGFLNFVSLASEALLTKLLTNRFAQPGLRPHAHVPSARSMHALQATRLSMAWKRSAAYPRRAPAAHGHRLDVTPCTYQHA